MRILILTAGFGIYIVFGLFVLFTDGGFFGRLLALLLFPFGLYGVIFYPHVRKWFKASIQNRQGLKSTQKADISLDMAYRLLDLPKNASQEQVNQQYRKLIHVVHPDVGGVTHLAKLLNEAKNIIISHASDSK